MKKLFAVLMAIALVFSMGTIAFAEGTGTGTITITNAVEGATYKLYRMLDFTPSNAEGTEGIYVATIEWRPYFNAERTGNYFDVVDESETKMVVSTFCGKTVF